MKKALLFLVFICSGLLTGYYSGPIYNFIWDEAGSALVSPSGGSVEAGQLETDKKYIPEDEAINALKQFGPVRQVMDQGGPNTSLDFSADRAPTSDFPVWLVEVKVNHPDKLPESRYYQVDAVTGRVLDLISEEMKIAGVGFSVNRSEVKKIMGRLQKTKRQYDKIRRQTVRTDTYEGMEIVYSESGQVIKCTASAQQIEGPRGIKTGMSKNDVLAIFGKPVTAMTDLMEYRPADNTNAWFVINLDNSGLVAGFSMEKAL